MVAIGRARENPKLIGRRKKPPPRFAVSLVKEMNMDRHKCARPDCRETFTGEKPEGWTSLEPVLPMRGTILFCCPVHSEQIMQEAYKRMLMEAKPEGNA